MRTLLHFSYIIFFTFNATAQDFESSTPVNVASGYGNYHPQIETLNDGNVGVIWTSTLDYNLYFTKSNSSGFETPTQLNPSGTEVQVYNWSGPDLAVYQNNIYVAYHDLGFETGHVYLVKSADNGATFGDTVRVDYGLVDAFAQFPDVAVYNDTVYVLYMVHGITNHNPQYNLAISIDGGQSINATYDVTSWIGSEACDCCQPELIVDASRVIILFRQNDSNLREHKAVISYDRGQTFTQLSEVDDHNWILAACPSVGPDARFLPNNNFIVAYKTSVGGMPKVYLNEFNPTTNTSIAEMDIYKDGIANTGISYPQVAVDGSSIGIVWEALGSGTDVFFNASTTGISGLQPTVTINVTDIAGSQSKPDITISNGIYHVVYAELTGAELKYVQINEVTSVNEVQSENNFSIYPNPTTTELNIHLPNNHNSTIRIYNIQGELVLEEFMFVNSSEINIEFLNSGIYILEVENEIFLERIKFTKQ